MKTNKILVGLFAVSVISNESMIVNAEEMDKKDSKGNIGFVAPETGALTLLNVADFDFGTNTISAKNETYNNKTETKTSVQDIRGTEAGWTVQVAQKGQFKTVEKELSNAQITLKTPTISAESTGSAIAEKDVVLNTDGSVETILEAKTGQGNGLTIESFDKDSATLEVPGETVKIAKQYETTLTWMLVDQPANI